MARIIKCATYDGQDFVYFDIDKVDYMTIEYHEGIRCGVLRFPSATPIYVPERVVDIVMNLKTAPDVIPNMPIDADDVFYDEDTGTYNIGRPEGFATSDDYHQMSIEEYENLSNE